MRYLLPCECGRKTPVSTRQAGETIECSCGRSLPIPTLRELRQLEEAPEAVEAPRRRLAWSPTQGVLFAVGGLLVVLALVVSVMASLQRSQLNAIQPRIDDDRLADHVAEIDQTTPAQTLDIWRVDVQEEGLESAHRSQFQVYRRVGRTLDRLLLVAGSGGLAGIVLIVSAFFIRPASRRRARHSG